MNEVSLELRVERGVALLNVYFPDWEQYINWDELDIWSTRYCILGQIAYETGVDPLRELGLNSYFEGQPLGFDLPGGGLSKDYAPLTEAWRNWARSKELI